MAENRLDVECTQSQAPRRSWLFRLLWPVTSYLVTNVTVTFLGVLFFVLNRTTVLGRRNVGEQPNTLLLCNHQSMLDSFLVGIGAFYPQSWLKPRLMPWNPAAAENFYKNPILAWLADNWKCIWVREGRRDLQALNRMTQVLPTGVMTLFPEGTRTRDGSVGEGRAGPGLLILGTKPRVIPVAIEGTAEGMPKAGLMFRGPMHARVTVLDPIPPSGDAEALRQAAHAAIEAALPAHARPVRAAG